MSRDGTILIVDDDADQRDTIRALLQAEGFRTVGAANGRLALDVLRLFTPALIVLDLQMPEVDGYAFDRARCADARLARIPEIVVSAFPHPHERLCELGAQYFLAKPVDPFLFLKLVRSIVRDETLDDETARRASRVALAQGMRT